MILTRPVYFIMWRNRPIQFMTYDHSPTDYFEDAAQYDSKEEAERIIATYDEPDQFEIVDGKFEVDI